MLEYIHILVVDDKNNQDDLKYFNLENNLSREKTKTKHHEHNSKDPRKQRKS